MGFDLDLDGRVWDGSVSESQRVKPPEKIKQTPEWKSRTKNLIRWRCPSQGVGWYSARRSWKSGRFVVKNLWKEILASTLTISITSSWSCQRYVDQCSPKDPLPFLVKLSVWSWPTLCNWSWPTWWREIDLEQNLNFFRPCPVQVETDSKEVGIDLKWLVLRLVVLLLVAWYTWCQDLQGPSRIVQTIGIKWIIIVTTLAWWPAHATMGRFLILWNLLPQVLELWEICKKSQNHQKIFERQFF